MTPMKSCAYCGGQNPTESTNCPECGTADFVVPAAPSVPATIAEPLADLPDPECDVSADTEAALCTFCLFPNLPEASWCKRCGASVSFASIVGPQDAALASGFMWRGAVRGRPKPFVLISVWLLFFPKLC